MTDVKQIIESAALAVLCRRDGLHDAFGEKAARLIAERAEGALGAEIERLRRDLADCELQLRLVEDELQYGERS